MSCPRLDANYSTLFGNEHFRLMMVGKIIARYGVVLTATKCADCLYCLNTP